MESLEKQLICPICLEMFTKPVVILPCQHNLCRKCANDVFQASNPYLSTRSSSTVTSGGRFRCPSCRHEVVLDRHGVYGLQRNLLVENIIDMYKQGSASSKPGPEPKVEQPMCDQHQDEKINIYCVSHGTPTCSLCKVFGQHKDCEVAPLDNVFHKQKTELADCVSMLVGNNDRIQAIISQLDETCRAVDENGRRQKSQVCEAFDHLFALLEEKKGDMTLRISAEQEEKMDYIRSLRRKYGEHLDTAAKLLENAIQALEQPEMALFLQTTKPLLQKIAEGTNMSHLDQLQPGYENMDHFSANFHCQRRALATVDFIKLDEEEDDDEDEVEIRGMSAGNRSEAPPPPGTALAPPPPLSPMGAQLVAPLSVPQRPSEAPPTPTKSPTPAAAPPLLPQRLSELPPTPTRSPTPAAAPPPLPVPAPGPAPTGQSEHSESDDRDGPKHVFSFSWLNQK